MIGLQERNTPFVSHELQFPSSSTGDKLPNPLPDAYQASDYEKSSFNFLSRFEQKLAQYNASENILKRWLFEILSVVTSAVCMGE